MSEHMNPMPGQVLAHVKNFDEYAETPGNYSVAETLDEANVITSRQITFAGDMHKPILDIDVPVTLVPSSTPGHFHLYIDKPMMWTHYLRMLDAMEQAGLIESGYVSASKSRGFTAVRLPWIEKETAPPLQPQKLEPF